MHRGNRHKVSALPNITFSTKIQIKSWMRKPDKMIDKTTICQDILVVKYYAFPLLRKYIFHYI